MVHARTPLQTALDRVLSAAPYEALATLVVKKLSAQGVSLSTQQRRDLVTRLQEDDSHFIRLRGWPWGARKVSVEFTPEEVDGLQKRLSSFLEQKLPDVIANAIEDISASILQTLYQRWSVESKQQHRDLSRFQKDLDARWGRAIERLRMFLTIARELEDMIVLVLRDNPDPARAYLRQVLTRLHARACQVTDEITCLLRAGFADGAMARWRTLHEIAVVAFFVEKHGEAVARRYVDHQAVESLRAGEDYQRCCERLRYEPLTEAELLELRQQYEELVKRYGTPFKRQHGWAAEALGMDNPSIRDIERGVGIDHLRAHYRMASHNVHANPKGVFFKLGLLQEGDMLLAGPSVAGLADPGAYATISLLQVTSVMATLQPTADTSVVLNILVALSHDVSSAFLEAHQTLQEDAERRERVTE